ncbi:GntR family transcriptional regulator [Actinomadura xylanilytica]|uniref:GntR family transcriptional regulator n=1 Tax=Actinomadura xylanilytica TaxID=887459 RepID=UPI00255A79E3|nr:GntR family transcriptional regulator [Actinomadura xylanilytica]MDL4776359.1 GntR family transcriptional regulator [Actinomadura xylanilytica]
MGKQGSPDRRKVYVRIADELRRDIAAGRYEVGEALPSIAKLRERFGAAGATVERGLAVLREESLIMSRQGSPSIVTRKPEQGEGTEGEQGEGAREPSEEFEFLWSQLQEIKIHLQRQNARLDEMDERTRGL